MFSDTSDASKAVSVFEEILSQEGAFERHQIETRGAFTIDFKRLVEENNIKTTLPDFDKIFAEKSEFFIRCIGLAMHHIMSSAVEEKNEFMLSSMLPNSFDESNADATILPVIHARITNYQQVSSLKNLAANAFGKFVCVKGTVIRVSNTKPLCCKMAFECNACGREQVLTLPDGKHILPTKCLSTTCRSKSFAPSCSSNQTEIIDWQTIRLQEIVDDDQKGGGRIPHTIDCELTNDLVDSCVPGDTVTVCGVVKVTDSDESRRKNSKDNCTFVLYIHANSVVSGNRADSFPGVSMDFTANDFLSIQNIQAEPRLFRLLVNSLCPTIHGHETVKAGLLLGLFGGSQKYRDDKKLIHVRGDPHILVVGDPGLGKSQMLQALADIAPRSVYVSGNTTTTAGLTVTLCSDGAGDCALEAGALVLADRGCCCIDEFDKMGNQHQALLEAMEQQSVSIAKAGTVCSLLARTSIIAAANPVGGHYNKAKTVSENLKMRGDLLSRFDLVFILLDKHDDELDCKVSEHVMAQHKGCKRKTKDIDEQKIFSQPSSASSICWSERTFAEQLKFYPGEIFQPIAQQHLRKYIGYARKYVHPKITKAAAKVLQDFYFKLRQRHLEHDAVAITTRQLEALIRLTEARARVELREEASELDANDAVELMKFSMYSTFSDENGYLDFRRSQHGSGMSSARQAKTMIAALTKIAQQTCNSFFTVQHMQQIAKDCGIHVVDFDSFISSLNVQGFILKKGPKMYKLLTVE